MLKNLVEARKAAGISQRQLADRLGREQSFVWRIETGERRLDVVEFHWVCTALERDSATEYARLANYFREVDPALHKKQLVAESHGQYSTSRKRKKS